MGAQAPLKHKTNYHNRNYSIPKKQYTSLHPEDIFVAFAFLVEKRVPDYLLRCPPQSFLDDEQSARKRAMTSNRQTDITGADPGFFLGGGALVSCSTSTPINHFFLQNTSCIRKPQVISGGVRTPCTLPLDPPLHQ